MMLMIPEAWADNPLMDAKRRAFYEYHAALMEPWDGPAAMAFTDGKFIGATLDRNGLRPARYFITDDDLVDHRPPRWACSTSRRSKIVKKWRLQPGKMLLVDIEHGRIVYDRRAEGRARGAAPVPGVARPHAAPPQGHPHAVRTCPRPDSDKLLDRQQAFGYTQEDLKLLMTPMAAAGRGGHRLHGRRHAARGALEPRRGRSTPTSASSSRR